MLMDGPIFRESNLVQGNDVVRNERKPTCHDFLNDFERKIQEADWFKIMER